MSFASIRKHQQQLVASNDVNSNSVACCRIEMNGNDLFYYGSLEQHHLCMSICGSGTFCAFAQLKFMAKVWTIQLNVYRCTRRDFFFVSSTSLHGCRPVSVLFPDGVNEILRYNVVAWKKIYLSTCRWCLVNLAPIADLTHSQRRIRIQIDLELRSDQIMDSVHSATAVTLQYFSRRYVVSDE